MPWEQDRNSVDTMCKKKDRKRNSPRQGNWLRTAALKRKTAEGEKEELGWGWDSDLDLDSENMDSKKGNLLAAFLIEIPIEGDRERSAFGVLAISNLRVDDEDERMGNSSPKDLINLVTSRDFSDF